MTLDISTRISEAFPHIDNVLVEDSPNLMEIEGQPKLLELVPAYMLWCVARSADSANLIHDYTINSLAEYGRCNDSENPYMNFRFLCNAEQCKVVEEFLAWCKHELLFIDEVQIERSLRHWAAAI